MESNWSACMLVVGGGGGGGCGGGGGDKDGGGGGGGDGGGDVFGPGGVGSDSGDVGAVGVVMLSLWLLLRCGLWQWCVQRVDFLGKIVVVFCLC